MVPKDEKGSPQNVSNLFRNNAHITWPRQALYLFKIRIGTRNFSFQISIPMVPKDQNLCPQHIFQIWVSMVQKGQIRSPE